LKLKKSFKEKSIKTLIFAPFFIKIDKIWQKSLNKTISSDKKLFWNNKNFGRKLALWPTVVPGKLENLQKFHNSLFSIKIH
jgi:hypothetical protein